MQVKGLFRLILLCITLVISPQTVRAQTTTAPEGWLALTHWYSGPYYSGPISVSRIPPQSQPYTSPSAACTAAGVFANQVYSGEEYVGELSDELEEGIKYPIFNYDAQQYEGWGHYIGYRCQLLINGEESAITEFGWDAAVAIVVIPKCPEGTGAGFFDGEVVCAREYAEAHKSKPNTCKAGDSPLTNPKRVQVGNPVAVDTGEKIEQEQDYATEDGLLGVTRWYRSAQRGPLTTTETPGFGRHWRGLLPGRIVAEALRSGGQIYSYLMEYQTDEGDYKRFYEDNWSFGVEDVTRLKLSMMSVPSVNSEVFFQENVASVEAQGEFKLAYANGDYILFSRTGDYNSASDERVLVPVERGFANGYKIWFDYSDASQYPNKMRDNLNREMSLSWEDIGWSSSTLVNVRKGPSPTAPSINAVREKAISAILLPDNTTVNYSYGVAESSGYKGRLENVARKNALGDLLWAHTYLYEDSRFPYSITGKSDQNGNRLSTYAYDDNGNAILTERAGGFDRQELGFGEEVVQYDPETGEPSGVTEQTVTNALGRTTHYKFITGANNLEGGASPLNSPARLKAIVGGVTANLPEDISETSYADGEPIGSIDANGNVSSQTVDLENSRPTTITDALGTPIGITWHAALDLPTRTVRKRLQTDFGYDLKGQLTSVSETDLDSGEVRTTQYTMGVAGRVQTINGPRGPDLQGHDDVTTMTYDTHGNRLTMTDALGHVTSFEAYDANGRVARVIDPNGVVTELSYDDLGRTKTVKVKHPTDVSKDAVTAMDYDIEGRVSAVTRPDTARINFDYNLAGLLTAIRSDDGERIDYGYDPMGNRLSETVKRADGSQASGIVRTFDELGRILTETLGPGRTHSYAYDKVGNAVHVTTARGGTYENSFDALNRLVGTLAPDAAHFNQYYDGSALPTGGAVVAPGSSAQNELGVFEDGRGVQTSFTRNAFGQITQEVSPDRGTSTYEYDLAGDLVAAVDGRGQRVEYTRDILGRVTKKTPIGRPASERITYSWDITTVGGSFAVGRLSRIDDGSGATRFGYDHRGNLTTRFQKLVGTPDWVTLRYAYDLSDRIETITYPSGRQVNYSRDAKGRVVSVRTRNNNSVTPWTTVASNMSYEPFGALKAISYGNGERMIINRGDDGRLDSRRLYRLADNGNISHLAYGYDADDNITRITDHLDATRTMNFAYDAVDRMKRVTAASGASQRTDYVFDGNGNRVKTLLRALPNDPPALATTENYQSTPGTNRLGSITGPAGTRSFTYDARGNLVSESRPDGSNVTAAYDGYGRLVSYARTGDASLVHTYNGLDDRVASTGGAGIRRYVYASDGRVLGEYGASASDVKAEFIWLSPQVGDDGEFGGDDGLGGYMPLAVAANDNDSVSQLSWVHASHMGVPLRYSDAGGITLPAPTTYSVPGFPGQSRTFADLYYNRYRDYDSSTGRYIQADPIGLAGGPSPYSYAMNNPIRYTDPTGEIVPILAAAAIGAVVGAGGDLAIQAGMNALAGRAIFDKDCYDWTSVGISAGLGSISGGYGGAIRSFGGRAIASRAAKVNAHHPIPKVLGGHSKQTLSNIPESVHKQLHSELRDALRHQGLARRIGGRGGSAEDWASDFAAIPGSQRRALDAALDASRSIDQQHGTNVTQDVWSNVMNGNFRIYP